MRLRLLSFLLPALFLAAPAEATWPTRAEYLGVPLNSTPTSGGYVRCVSDGENGAIVLWLDARDLLSRDLYVQRIDADGNLRWPAEGVRVSQSATIEESVEMISDGQGGVFVTSHGREASSLWSSRVVVQRVNSAGVAMWGPDGVEVTMNASALGAGPQLALDGAGGVFVAWGDERGSRDVYGQHLSGSGVELWASGGVALADGAFHQRNPRIAPDGAGGVFLAFDDGTAELEAATDVSVQRIDSGGNRLWASAGIPVVQQPQNQVALQLIRDAEGGMIVLWRDRRFGSGAQSHFVQRVTASGAMRWGLDGTVLIGSGDQGDATMVSDDAGGAYVCIAGLSNFVTYRVTLQRILPNGATAFGPSGLDLSAGSEYRADVALAADGNGGAIAAWMDGRGGGSGTVTYAQRVRPEGVKSWAASGLAVAVHSSSLFGNEVVSDGRGGAIVCWPQASFSSGTRAKRVESFGVLGSPEPILTSVRDLANDQGGFVKVSWARSHLDADPTYGVESYRLWRSVPALSGPFAQLGEITRDSDVAAATGALFEHTLAGVPYAWELAGTQIADGLPTYSFVAATTSDSIPGSSPHTVFMVEARAGTFAYSARWYSAPDSGYSVDNLPPLAPQGLQGAFAAAAMHLTWSASREPDLAGYRIYRGATPSFAIGAVTWVGTSSDPHFSDPAPRPFVYKVTAVDVHGNESAVATFVPVGTVGVEDAAAPTLAFTLTTASPSRQGATFALELPGESSAHVALFDMQGRERRVLHSGGLAAGRHLLVWDGRDTAGASVASGVLFARCIVAGRTFTRRLVVTR